MSVTWPIVRADELGTGDIVCRPREYYTTAGMVHHTGGPFWTVTKAHDALGGVFTEYVDGCGNHRIWMHERNDIIRKREAIQ